MSRSDLSSFADDRPLLNSNAVVEATLTHLHVQQQRERQQAFTSTKVRHAYLVAFFAILGALLAFLVVMAWKLKKLDDTSPAQNVIPAVSGATQVSILDAIFAGLYDGKVTVGEMRSYGSFGVGVFSALDGTLVILDGIFYRLGHDGSASHAADDLTLPYAVVTRAVPDPTEVTWTSLPSILSYTYLNSTASSLSLYLDTNIIATTNQLYAIRVHATFHSLVLSSVSPQVKPYEPFLECVFPHLDRIQVVNTTGTLVGFRSPSFVTGFNKGGYDFYYISDDLQYGGHVQIADIGCQGQVLATPIPEYRVVLPVNDPIFDNATFPYQLQDPKKVCRSSSTRVSRFHSLSPSSRPFTCT